MTGSAPAAVSPGRPKDAGKRIAILAAAKRLFFAHGPQSVTIEAVAAAASVSRMTVYGHFVDKDTLFAAVIAEQARMVGQALAKISQRAAAVGVNSRGGVRRDLIAFGVDLTGFLLQPDLRAFNRLMEAEAGNNPTLAAIFIEAGPRAVFRSLTERLRIAAEHGAIAAAEPAKAARHLTGLFKSIETSAMSVGLAPSPTPAEIERHVTECVDLFLRGYAPARRTTGKRAKENG